MSDYRPEKSEMSSVEFVQDALRERAAPPYEIDSYIARADALLDGTDADFYRPFVAAFRAFHRALARPGTEGE